MTGQPDNNQMFKSPIFLIPVAFATIYTLKWFKPKINRFEASLRADELAPLYLKHKTSAAKGNAESQRFIEAANRRLRTHRDEALLGNTKAKLFLEELSARGVLESDYK